jgi:hypothetical protein
VHCCTPLFYRNADEPSRSRLQGLNNAAVYGRIQVDDDHDDDEANL